MRSTALVITPANWFDLTRLASCSEAGTLLEFTIADADGRRPLAGVRLDELWAIHQTFGAWWSRLGGDSRPHSLEAGTYGRFLGESRSLLKEQAEALLEHPNGEGVWTPARVSFPDLDHVLLADSDGALAFFRPFLALSHPLSLVEWARTRSIDQEAVSNCGSRAWLRLVLQKVASEDGLHEALACLRAVYGGSDTARSKLLSEEARLLEQCDLVGPEQWARSLGIHHRTRVTPWVTLPRSPRSPGSDKPDTTVIVPAFCHEAFIETTLASLLAQTHPDFRVLVVDDCSSDRTIERVGNVRDKRVRVEVNERNLGLGDSVLRVLDTIDTPYAALLNSDDVFHPERLERCLAVLESSERTQVAATSVVPIDAEGHRLTIENVSRLFDGPQVADWIQWFSDAGHVDRAADLFAQLLERNFLITSSNIVCRTEFLRGRREALRGLEFCFDWQVFLDAALRGVLAYVPEELLAYRLHASNTVWFDRARRERYVIEVNRVLARALRSAVEHWTQVNAGSLQDVLELVLRHAAKHSEANGLLLYAAELLTDRTPESPDRARAMRRYWQSVHASRTTVDENAADRTTTSAGADAFVTAARVLAQVSLEETRAARDAEEWVRMSPEWRVGDMLWNRARLARIGRPAARALRQLQDRGIRWRLAVGGRARRNGSSRPRAVVASCWKFPIQSHTFVYQEIQALEWAGLDYRLFCCETTSRTELHAGLEDLWRKRVVLRADARLSGLDLDYFLRTRPKRVEGLLDRLRAATRLSKDALLREPIVMMGFTFARHVELARAEYLHTYFFYDQSFMALMAGYLLGLPRGVTAYADHMLNDYAFKCVPLHLELADLVVATSRRIKNELSAIGGGRFDSKILVKPNGIDIGQFPFVDAAERLNAASEPELISVSRIEPKKGLIYLIEALRILKDRGVPVRLSIVGGVDPHTSTSPAYFRELVSKIEQLELSERIVLHGAKKRQEFIPLLMRARIFVAPYVEIASGDKDGIPTAVLEAMSTGLPIVATDAGSISEAVTDGVEAVSVPQRDPERLADAIERVLGDRAMYARMGEAARRRAVSEFDVHVTEKALHERIRACIHASRS